MFFFFAFFTLSINCKRVSLILLHSYYYICIGDRLTNESSNQKNKFLGWLSPSLFIMISNEHIFFSFLHEHLDIYAPFKSLVDHSDLCP